MRRWGAFCVCTVCVTVREFSPSDKLVSVYRNECSLKRSYDFRQLLAGFEASVWPSK